MGAKFRQQDELNRARLVKALREDVFGAHPELSLELIAANLNRGADDPMPVSLDTLQAVLNGYRKLPLHKVGRLKRVIEAHTADREDPEARRADRTINELCRQAGGIYVEVDAESPHGNLLDLVQRFGVAISVASDALKDGNVSDAEFISCEEPLRRVASGALALLHHIGEKRNARMEPSSARW